jgi:hypothetical protein
MYAAIVTKTTCMAMMVKKGTEAPSHAPPDAYNTAVLANEPITSKAVTPKEYPSIDMLLRNSMYRTFP